MNTMDFETSFSVCALSGQITSYVWTLILGLSCSYCEKKIFNTFQDFFYHSVTIVGLTNIQY